MRQAENPWTRTSAPQPGGVILRSLWLHPARPLFPSLSVRWKFDPPSQGRLHLPGAHSAPVGLSPSLQLISSSLYPYLSLPAVALWDSSWTRLGILHLEQLPVSRDLPTPVHLPSASGLLSCTGPGTFLHLPSCSFSGWLMVCSGSAALQAPPWLCPGSAHWPPLPRGGLGAFPVLRAPESCPRQTVCFSSVLCLTSPTPAPSRSAASASHWPGAWWSSVNVGP